MTILSIINELAATSSRLEKEAILKREKSNSVLKRVFSSTLNPFTNYYLKKIPQYNANEGNGICLNFAIDTLNDLAFRHKTGNAGIAHLKDTLESLNRDDAIVIERIVERDLRCGVSEATVNKIWTGLIPTFDVCLAHKDISHIKYPAYAQTKMDGARCHMMWDGVEAKLFSRNGKVFEVSSVFNEAAARLMDPGEVWDGELLFYEGGKPMDRKTSNGIANKALKGTLSKEEAFKAVFVCWDDVDFSGKVDYFDRWSILRKRFDNEDTVNFKLCHTVIVRSEQEANEFFNEMLERGEEGAILKNMDFKWEPKRVKGVGKMKAELDSTLEVVSVEEGTGKNAGRMGALVCQSKDGYVKVNVGTGFSDELREEFWVNPPKFIDVTYNAIVNDKSTGQNSLFLPRFLKVRLDKEEADVLL